MPKHRARRSPRRSEPRRSFSPVAWIALGTTALGLRLLYMLSVRASPFFHNLQTNPQRYHDWASLILDGHAPPPPFEQVPGYAYFVAAIYRMFGPHIEAVAVSQAILDSGTCVLLALAARRYFGERAGWIAGVLAAFYGPFIYFSAELLPASLFVFLTSAAIVASLSDGWSAAGILWSLAVLVRGEALFALPLVGLDAARRGGRAALLRTALPVAVVVLACIAINSAASGRLAPMATSGGLNLWLGNNPHADGVSPFVSGPLERAAEHVRELSGNDALAADRLFRGQALRFWRDYPLPAFGLLCKKLRWTWTARELPNTSDIDWQTSYSWLFALPLLPLRFGVVLPLAMTALPLLPRRRRELLLLGAWLAPGLAACVVFFTNARFRLVMVPALLLLAAHSLDQLPGWRRTWRNHQARLVAATIGGLLGIWIAWSDAYGVRLYRIPQIDVNTGALEREADHFPAAIEYLRRGLAVTPLDPIAWVHLALALEQNGDRSGALQAYLDGLALQPDDATLIQMAQRFFERQRLDSAQLDTFRATSSQQLRQTIGKALAAALH
jgi:hypothetical protein